MTQETIDRLHELEERRKGLEVQMEELRRVLDARREDVMVEFKVYSWHTGQVAARMIHIEPEVMDAVKTVCDRKSKELEEVNKMIEEL